MSLVVAVAPWALVVFVPASEGAPAAGLTAQASESVTEQDYPPLLVVPLDSPTVDGALSPSASRSWVTAGPASPPPLWLVNSQLRQPASAGGPGPLVSPAVLDSLKATGIPRRAFAAYINAAAVQDRLSLDCHLSWQVLAGIGYIESNHARSGGSAGPNWSGVAIPPIYGSPLDGSGDFATIRDTDQGVLDGNTTYDRAVGPMQFLPSTWREYEEGASGKAAPDPQNIDDATLTAARYLCATGQDLRTPDGLIAAVYGYNHSFDYVTAVLSVAVRYAGGKLAGGASALAQLPELAKTASSLPTPSAAPSVIPSLLPHPSSAPASGPSFAALPTLTYPTPPELTMPIAPLPSPSWPPSSPSTGTPLESPDSSADSSPAASASASPAPESSAPLSPSPSPSAGKLSDPVPTQTTVTP